MDKSIEFELPETAAPVESRRWPMAWTIGFSLAAASALWGVVIAAAWWIF